LAPASVAYAVVGCAQGAELTVDRLFDAPALTGPSIVGLKISPEGSRVTYLKGKVTDKDRLDLWEYNIHDGASQLLVDSNELSPSERPLSDEERARRERQRTAALSGIVEYTFAPKGDALLFPLNGELYYYKLGTAHANPSAELIPTTGPITDATVSPRGAYVAYVRDQNLVTFNLRSKQERALTTDGGGVIKNGMAEFVAQEEMDRDTGYWWAPDDRHVAFERVDETPLKVMQRFEIAADNVNTFAQRYPEAGGQNVLVELGVADVGSGAITWIDLGTNKDIYLARVDWLPDGKTLAIQRQSRDQRRLDLLFADVATGETRLVLTESSSTWVDLNDELTFLEHSNEFIWASSRSGYRHLYLHDAQGKLLRQLTDGKWVVDDFRARAIKCVDEKHRLLYFTATAAGPLERQLYSVSLDTHEPQRVHRISREPGLHGVSMPPNAGFYIDNFTSHSQPPSLALRAADGSLKAWLSENHLDASHPDAPYVADNSVPEFATLKADDGQDLYYRLMKPAHFDPAKRYPAIVEVYGGPGVQSVLDKWYGGSFAQILTRAGYVVFQLDNRGSAFRGTAFESPIHGKLGDVEFKDQVTGARWLAAQSYIDPKRIGVWGWSYGGYMTLMLMFKAPEIFHAGVSGAPVTDWRLYDTHYTERYLNKPQDNAAGYDLSSVLPYAENLQGDLLLMHGMADDNVFFLNSTKLYRRLQDLGKPFEVMVYPGAKHGLTRQHDGRHAFRTILAFFGKNL
jgi:dipeptidyl-peptidase 4